MADPSDAHAMDEVGGFTGSPIVLRLARESEIEHALSRVYARPGGPLSPPPTPPGAPKDTRPPSGAASSIEEALSVEIEVDLVDEEESSSAAPSRPSQSGREPPAPPPSTSLDLPSALEQIRGASSRDAVIDLAVRAMAAFCRRAAFFIVRKGNVEGWQASGEGLVRSQIKKLWIPVTSASVFKDAMEGDGVTVAPLYDSTANRILAAAIGPRPAEVLLAVIRVQGRALGFLYGDTFTLSAAQTARIESLQAAVADAFERVLLGDKHK